MPFPWKPEQLSTNSSRTNCSVCVRGGGRVGVEGQEEGGGGGSQWQVGNPSCCLSLCELRGPQP